MRKILKIMFSQFTIVSFLLILQLLAITASLMRISEYFVYFNMFLQLVSAITVVIIINRHSNPSYKLAWVIPILMFPLFGGLFYLFITGQMHTKYYFSKLESLEKVTNGKYPQNKDVLREITENFPHRERTINYINNVTGMNAHRCVGAEYFPQGERMFEHMIEDIKKAEKYIFLEYFIIGEGIMWDKVLEVLRKKAAEGVDVRVMYDGMGSMTLLPQKYPQILSSYGIKCRVFSPFTPFLSALQNNRDHRKITVIDGKIAYTGGINLADEYINIGYKNGHWKDMAVKVEGEAAFSFTRMFLQLWWNARDEKENIEDFYPTFSKNDHERRFDGYVMPYCDKPQDSYQVGEFIYFDIINKAKKYVYITTPYLILDHEMVVALTNAAYSGVDVKIICPKAIDHWYARAVAYSYYKELTDAGVKIYEYTPGFIHGKTFCSDNEICVVGSINLDYRSLYLHFECASCFIGSTVTDSVRKDFENTLEKCCEITPDFFKSMNPIRKIINAILRLFAPLM